MSTEKKLSKEAEITKHIRELAKEIFCHSHPSILKTINEVVKSSIEKKGANLSKEERDRIWDANRKEFSKRIIESAKIFMLVWTESRQGIVDDVRQFINGEEEPKEEKE